MSETHRALFGNRAGHAERLKPLADSDSRVGSFLATLLYGNRTTYGVSPRSVFESYGLGGFDYLVYVDTVIETELSCRLEILYAVFF